MSGLFPSYGLFQQESVFKQMYTCAETELGVKCWRVVIFCWQLIQMVWLNQVALPLAACSFFRQDFSSGSLCPLKCHQRIFIQYTKTLHSYTVLSHWFEVTPAQLKEGQIALDSTLTR